MSCKTCTYMNRWVLVHVHVCHVHNWIWEGNLAMLASERLHLSVLVCSHELLELSELVEEIASLHLSKRV
jgi:hypothetical protein